MKQFLIFSDLLFIVQYTVKEIIFAGKNTGYRCNRMCTAVAKDHLLLIEKNKNKMELKIEIAK